MTETLTRGAANQSGAHINKDAYKEAKDFLPLNGLDHVEWCELSSHGYVIVDVDQARARGEWWHVDTVRDRCHGERIAAAYEVARGETALRAVSARAASLRP